MTSGESVIPIERIERAILLIRGQRVMLDSDLANLYGVPTKRLNEQESVTEIGSRTILSFS
jgi:hypothetical protein